MSDLCEVYSSKELEGLNEKDKDILRKELRRLIRASREIRAIIYAHDELNDSLKDKLRDTYVSLKKR